MKRINLTESQWLELDSAATNIAKSIQQKLPSDWKLNVGDIKSRVYDSYIATLNSYDPTKNTSPVAYCLMFAKNSTYSALIDEYKRLKQQDDLYVAGELDDGHDDDRCRHKHGIAEISHNMQFPMEELENKDACDKLYKKANKVDQMIFDMVKEGKSYDCIAKELGFASKMQIMRRLKKYQEAE